MAIYKVKTFGKFARKNGISDESLAVAATEVRDGRFDAALGGGLYKQRVARKGSGKSGGFRTLITRKTSAHLFFVYGFPKNAKANIDSEEEKTLKLMATRFGGFTQDQLDRAVASGALEEVSDGDSEE